MTFPPHNPIQIFSVMQLMPCCITTNAFLRMSYRKLRSHSLFGWSLLEKRKRLMIHWTNSCLIGRKQYSSPKHDARQTLSSQLSPLFKLSTIAPEPPLLFSTNSKLIEFHQPIFGPTNSRKHFRLSWMLTVFQAILRSIQEFTWLWLFHSFPLSCLVILDMVLWWLWPLLQWSSGNRNYNEPNLMIILRNDTSC